VSISNEYTFKAETEDDEFTSKPLTALMPCRI